MSVLALLALGAGVGAGTSGCATAAFSARTASVNNVFRVGTWPALTLGRAATCAVLAATRITN
ncbi:hypothetical protein V2J56_12230 [Georgenia sp. MJ206]|uniref:hypothetical protein n=1 Tax=Georgenia wangjunii TaxID=3117730 RepID=UPI002F2626F2